MTVVDWTDAFPMALLALVVMLMGYIGLKLLGLTGDITTAYGALGL